MVKVYSVWFDTTVCGNHDHTYSRGIHKPLKVYSVWFDTTVCGNHDHTYSRGIHKPLKVYSVVSNQILLTFNGLCIPLEYEWSWFPHTIVSNQTQ
jgi:hypothetical protein